MVLARPQSQGHWVTSPATSHGQVGDFRVSPRDKSRDVPEFVCRVVSCSYPDSIRTTQTGLSPNYRGIFPNHLDMSRSFETPKLLRDIRVSWSTSATSPRQVADFPETSPSHVSRRRLGERGLMEFGLKQPKSMSDQCRQITRPSAYSYAPTKLSYFYFPCLHRHRARRFYAIRA